MTEQGQNKIKAKLIELGFWGADEPCDPATDTHDAAHPDRCNRFSGALVSGAYGGFFVIDTAEEVSIIGVHFKPGGAFPFLGLPAGELADAHVNLETL
jgi:hypothetical protein